jgi:hypothetical protein
MAQVKTEKQVQVLATYRFNLISRICFSVRSSDKTSAYQTCFDKDAEHGSCTCKGGARYHKCYHMEQLKPVAQVYFAERQAMQVGIAYFAQEAEIARAEAFLSLKAQYDVREQVAIPALETVPMQEAMAEAQEAMVQFGRDSDPNAYEVLAETKVRRLSEAEETSRAYREIAWDSRY